MVEKVTAWTAKTGGLFPSEEAARDAEIYDGLRDKLLDEFERTHGQANGYTALSVIKCHFGLIKKALLDE